MGVGDIDAEVLSGLEAGADGGPDAVGVRRDGGAVVAALGGLFLGQAEAQHGVVLQGVTHARGIAGGVFPVKLFDGRVGQACLPT